jgi:hypothetical protein
VLDLCLARKQSRTCVDVRDLLILRDSILLLVRDRDNEDASRDAAAGAGGGADHLMPHGTHW